MDTDQDAWYFGVWVHPITRRVVTYAEGDVTIVDPEVGAAITTFVAGKPVLREGSVVGTGGTVLVTAMGEEAVKATGLDYAVIDVSQSKMYR